MIVDSIKNADKYFLLYPRFAKVFEFIRQQDLENMPAGKFEIEGKEIHGFVSEKEGAKKEEAKFESHRNYIDIQFCPKGKEVYGWSPVEKCTPNKDGYIAEKDATYYNKADACYFTLQAGEFAIFFPNDVHAAGMGEGMVKKLVLKVKI